MGYIEFDTLKAHYFLELGDHEVRNEHLPLKSVDAWVVETGGGTLEKTLRDPGKQLGPVIEHCMLSNKTVYSADVSTSAFGILRDMLTVLPINIVTLTVWPRIQKSYTNRLSEDGRRIQPSKSFKRYADYQFLLQTPVVEARNAMNAEKIEGYIVPWVARRTNKNKPTIGMIYGSGHNGLMYDLQTESRRKLTLWNWRNLNFPRYAGLKRKYLDTVQSAEYVRKKWQITSHKTGLVS